MLVLDDKQIKAEDCRRLFKIPLDKILKRPIYKINEKLIKKDRRGRKKKNEGFGFRPEQWVIHPETGMKVKFRYAANVIPTKVADRMIDKYHPMYIDMKGEVFEYYKNPDLAVFLYIHIYNENSPLRTAGNSAPAKYYLDDPALKAKNSLDTMSLLKENLAFIEKSDIDTLKILAKGLRQKKYNIHIDDETNEDSVKAGIGGFATHPSTTRVFHAAISNQVILFQGKVVTLIDRGIFKVHTTHGLKQWFWEAGDRQGEPVGPQITNPLQDMRQTLLNFMMNNIDTYIREVDFTMSSSKAEEIASKFFNTQEKAVEIPDYLKGTPALDKQIMHLPDVEDLEACKTFVEAKGYKKIPAKIKQFRDAYREGMITLENVDGWLKELYSQPD